MDTKPLETFAQSARRQLHEQVAARLNRVLTADSAELRAKAKTVEELKAQVAASSRRAVIERVAYTWFNRFCALRYMDVNHYTRVGTVSPAPGFTQPEILQEAKQGHVDDRFARTIDLRTVFGLLNGSLPSGDSQQEAYRLLLVGVCNAYHDVMPLLFEKIDDYTELLMPEDLLSESSILQGVCEALSEQNCQDVEVIGWLYQFYISEKKDAVMARKGAVPSEDIPARTQLFTPHWIVRYMVENSLGRLWMLNHPESRLVERMDYYIAPEGEIADFLRVASPEEIRLCDPACGSGHILTYAFDLLYAIYEEQGYNPVDIPRLILEKNLTGIEIDPRAGALAGFALMMKARDKDRRFFQRDVRPDICVLEDVTFTPGELNAYMDAIGRDLFTQHVRDWLRQFEQATTFGSLIRPLITDTAFIQARLDASGVFQDLFLSHTHDKLQAVLRITEALRPRYQVAVANPPYMGSGNMNVVLKRLARDKYPKSKSDLCTMFIERNLDLVAPGGYVGMITMQSWMFLSSSEMLRADILRKRTIETMAHLGPRAFDTIGGEVVSTTAFTMRRKTDMDHKGQYLRLIDGKSEAEKAQMLLDDLQADNCYLASAVDFKKIPGAPIAYWVSDRVRQVFEDCPSLARMIETREGLTTGSNDTFLRRWWEVQIGRVHFNANSVADTKQHRYRWYPYVKGGAFRRWSGNFEYVVNWENDGQYLRDFVEARTGRVRSHNYNGDYAFRVGFAWSGVSGGDFSVRHVPGGFKFDAKGPMGFVYEENSVFLCEAFLNTNLVGYLMRILAPTLDFKLGHVLNLPLVEPRSDIAGANCKRCILLSETDWNTYETSWGFARPPTLPDETRHSLAAVYVSLRARWKTMTDEMNHLEAENNHLFVDVYGLRDELSPKVPLDETTLTCNPHYRYGSARLDQSNWAVLCEQAPETGRQLAAIAAEMAPDIPEEERLGLEQRLLDDTVREFISYAVGCIFGRYSLDKPGLILANQGETLEDYLRQVPEPTFVPDEDNVIPMLDGDWFADDVSERFKQFLRVTFGDAHYEENLAFVEAAIGRDVRGYFVREFYADHVKTYKKRPIYWLFSSPKGSFGALIYMHRYRPDTVSVVLNDYLREFRAKLAARRHHLEEVERSAGATQRDKTRAIKEIEQIDRVLNELREYEDEVLYPLAAQQVEIDLDDGVLVNYSKLGKALRQVSGLSSDD